MKILILKPSSLGDVVQALPVVRLLKRHDATHEIHWWISTHLRDLLDRDPDLAGVIPFERRRWAHPRHWGELFRSLGAIRQAHFDWVIDLQGLARSSVVAWLAGAKLTAGVEDWREGAPALYDISVPRPSPLTHAVDWYLEVLKVLNVPVHWDFVWLPERPEAARSLRKKWNPPKGPWVALNPGARWPNKRWPVEYYVELVRQLTARDVHLAILGDKNDASLGAALSKLDARRCLDLTGQTTLSEMIEWLRLSTLLVSNDTGPMHIAAALGKPVIAIFGPTEPRRTGPYGQLDRVLRVSLPCAPCLKSTCHLATPLECLRAVSPAQVCAAVDQLLNFEPAPVEL